MQPVCYLEGYIFCVALKINISKVQSVDGSADLICRRNSEDITVTEQTKEASSLKRGARLLEEGGQK